MLAYNGRLSLYCFVISAILTIFISVEELCSSPECLGYFAVRDKFWWLLPSYSLLINLSLKLLLRGFPYQVCVRSCFLGSVLSVGVYLIIHAPEPWNIFGWYICVMAIFHYSEFLAIAWCNPRTLSIDSFILNHSAAYNVAAVASWIEFGIESYFFPGIKYYTLVSWFGLLMCLAGEVIRKCAMVTAQTNFSHLVQSEKEDSHVLVTHGIYGLCRHPSYVGWFYWSIGTQLLLLNPICTAAYTIASWRFFYERVLLEEVTLLNFFGQEYMDYQAQVKTGLPFINGFVID